MFTGIIEEVGRIRYIKMTGMSAQICIEANVVLDGLRLGDSVAVNGVCLTVTSLGADFFTADIMPETMHRSNLHTLKKSDQVNLERAMDANGRFGGHIVSGHIDGTGMITGFRADENAVWVTISCDASILQLVIEKGSITIDGISLTVATVEQDSFSVSVIPHTARNTTLLSRKVGSFVNLENDVIGKYVKRLLSFEQKQEKSHITYEMLEEYL